VVSAFVDQALLSIKGCCFVCEKFM